MRARNQVKPVHAVPPSTGRRTAPLDASAPASPPGRPGTPPSTTRDARPRQCASCAPLRQTQRMSRIHIARLGAAHATRPQDTAVSHAPRLRTQHQLEGIQEQSWRRTRAARRISPRRGTPAATATRRMLRRLCHQQHQKRRSWRRRRQYRWHWQCCCPRQAVWAATSTLRRHDNCRRRRRRAQVKRRRPPLNQGRRTTDSELEWTAPPGPTLP